MRPALFVEFGFKTFRQARVVIVAHIANSARHAGPAAWAGALAFPRLIRMVFANPAAVLRTESISLAGLDRIAQSLHGEFDILRLAGAA
jgi:hypothetical protein